jgi:integrase
MAHLIRPWVVHYVDATGKRCSSATPGAKKVRKRAGKWYGAGVPGLKKRVPLASDKGTARRMLQDLLYKTGRAHGAGFDGRADDAAKVELTAHLDDFEASLRAKSRGVSEEGIKLTMGRLRRTFDACGFRYPNDINADDVLEYLADRRRLPRDQDGLSIQTSNFYLKTVKQFCKWMCNPHRRRMAFNPMESDAAECGDPKLDKRHHRRDLKPDELARLLDATGNSTKVRRFMTGEDRRVLYLTACGTGFRRGELASLTPESFDLDGDPPTATVKAGYAKNRKTARQPLPHIVVEALRPWLAGKPAGEPVWPTGWWKRSARMFRADLKAAGIPYVVKGPDGPLFADFHCLRHSYISLMERAGVGLNDAKELARHSTIVLTKDRYTHADGADLAAAVNRLALPGASAEGTDARERYREHQLLDALALAWTVLGSLLGLPLFAPCLHLDGAAEEDAAGPAGTKGAERPTGAARRKRKAG